MASAVRCDDARCVACRNGDDRSLVASGIDRAANKVMDAAIAHFTNNEHNPAAIPMALTLRNAALELKRESAEMRMSIPTIRKEHVPPTTEK